MEDIRLRITEASYNSFAGIYSDAWGTSWRRQDYSRIRKFLNRLQPGEKILDAGCGTGHILQFFLEEGYDGYGIDVSAGMLAEAAARIGKGRLRLGSLEDMGYEDGWFDGLFSRHVLQHALDLPKALSEFARVVKSGGVVYLAVHISLSESAEELWYEFPNNGGRIFMRLRSRQDVVEAITLTDFTMIETAVTAESAQMRNLHLLLQKA